MDGLPTFPSEPLGDLADENALLRASLSEARERLGELEARADRDALTPLANRRRFLGELDRVVGLAQRHGTTAALLSIDIRGLEAINATHGRLAGDAALIHVAETLSGLIRSTDLLARTGDDEFGLILDHLDHNSAIETADRLASCIARTPVDLGGPQVRLEASIATTSILPGDSAEDVLVRAAANMSRAKEDA